MKNHNRHIHRDFDTLEMTKGGSLPDSAPEVAEPPDTTAPGAAAERDIADGLFLSQQQSAHAEEVCGGIPLWKRILDLTCLTLTFPIWMTFMVFIALWIKAVSPGPGLFRQQRVGHRGRRFMILKFRSMKVNVETDTHEQHFARLMQADCPMTKLDVAGDSRLIPGARILRATGLDELPQIFNVLRGDMSLVGPRPCTPHEFQRYQPWQQQRVNAPPGLTGYWQVNGKNKTTFSEMIAMDLFYANNMSARLDLGIMLRTIPAIITQVLEARATHPRRWWKRALNAIAPTLEPVNESLEQI